MEEEKAPQTPRRRRRRRFRMPPWMSLVVTIPAALAIGLWFGATRGFFVPSESMLPAIEPEDRVQADTWFAKQSGPQRGEIWVIENPDPELRSGPFVLKRLLGLPGETIEMRSGKLLINGSEVSEDYVRESATKSHPPTTLKANEYWFLGDNRNYSDDSRNWGPVHKTRLTGRIFLRFWPIHRITFFN